MKTVEPYRNQWLRDELRNRQFAQLEAVLDQQLQIGASAGLIHFYRGELHRLRDEEGDTQRAVESYEQAVRAGDAPAETYRALGLLHLAAGDGDKADRAFKSYLAAAPSAEDRAMIESYIENP